MPRPTWLSDLLIVMTFAAILAVLSVVNVRTLQQTYEQNERLNTVNQFLDCLDPTTPCGMKLAENQAEERKFLTDTMKGQAICTLLTSRTIGEEKDLAALERVYNECVLARAEPPPKPSESPLPSQDKDKGKR